MAETRKDKRAPVSLKVRFKSATVDEFIEQYAKDISRGGVFIKSKQPMPVGTLLKFEIQLKDETSLIHGVGRVVWKREASAGGSEDAPSGMGIKFIRMDPESRALVERIVEARGGLPGQYEAGGGDADEGPAEAAPQTPRRKPTLQGFFPPTAPGEADLPRPEDRTQVRHASEFLASALAEAGAEEAAREAERKAEEARQRAERLEAQRREEAARRAAEQQAAARAEQPRAEAAAREAPKKVSDDAAAGPKAVLDAAKQAAEPVAEAASGTSQAAPSDAAPERAAPAVEASASAAPTKTDGTLDRSASRPQEPAAAKADAPARSEAQPRAPTEPARPVEPSRPTPAAQGERPSYALPVAIGLLAVLGLAYLAHSRLGGEAADSEAASRASRERAPSLEQGEPDERGEPEERGEARAVASATADEPGTPEEPGVPDEPGAAQGEVPTAVGEASREEREAVAATETGAAETGSSTAPEVEPTPAPTTRLRIETTPAGATVSVDGTPRGASPLEIDVPVGTAITIAAHLEGYLDASQQVTPVALQRPVRLTLQPLPWVIEVTTEPAGARVRAGGRTATTASGAPSRITVARPTAPVQLVATRGGYEDATATVAPTQFELRGNEMVATVSLRLAARPSSTTAGAAVRTGGGAVAAGRSQPGGDATGAGERASSGPAEGQQPREGPPSGVGPAEGPPERRDSDTSAGEGGAGESTAGRARARGSGGAEREGSGGEQSPTGESRQPVPDNPF